MPNQTPEREQDPSGAGDVRRSWRRPALGAGLVAGVALVIVIAGGALSGGPPGGPATARSAAQSPAPSLAPAAAVATPSPADSPLPDLSGSPSPAPTASLVDATTSPSVPPAETATPGTATTAPTPSSSQASSSSGPPQVTAALAARLDARLQTLLKRSGIPGVSAAIIWDDGRTWAGAAGSADLATRTAMTPDTAFALASVSKTLTAGVVLQLVGEGRLALDQPVAPLLPAFKLDRRITVRMLLDHTSGLPDYFLNASIDRPLQARPDAAWTPLQAWRYVPAKHFTPGRSWHYSNTNYLLLGELVKAVTGRSLASEVRTRLLGPLRLRDTWYQAVEKPRTKGATGYRRVVKPGGGSRYLPVAPSSDVMPFRSVVTSAGGAGSIASTAMDAAVWMRAFAGGEVLPADVQAAMVGDVARTKALGSTIPYGLGIQAVRLDGRKALGHSGRYLGFRNVVRYVPAAGVTIAVLTNQGTYDPARIATYLLRIASPRRSSAAPSPTP